MKLEKEREYLNDFHKQSTLALLKEVESYSNQPFSSQEMLDQMKRLTPKRPGHITQLSLPNGTKTVLKTTTKQQNAHKKRDVGQS